MVVKREGVELTEALTSFLDQHILWLPRERTLGVRDLKEAGAALAWMFGPSDWRTIITGLWATLKTRWPAALQ